MADRPTTPRLDVLIDRACRHLTPAESAALREEVAVLQQRATALDCMEREQRARAERAEQQAAAVRAECDAIEREQYPVADDGMAIAVRRMLAALDATGQPDTEEAGR